MLHFEVELEVAYEVSSRLHYIIYLHYIRLPIRLPDFFFFSTWYVTLPDFVFFSTWYDIVMTKTKLLNYMTMHKKKTQEYIKESRSGSRQVINL